ncbi:MAG TPA: 30S ribosome-binding factor RbfA [Gammaproteobacteria bacterium]|nr:30S ribosome-binding factor RbfA [Gammaproteobacteria bacterium]
MARDYPRSYRVADQIQREIVPLIRDELKDPRVSPLLTISAVEVTRDLSIATIFYTVLNEDQLEATDEALQEGLGAMRHLLSKRLTLRAVPILRFVYDTSMEEGSRLSGLIDAAVRSNTTPGDDT